jgi:cytochrome c553
VTIVTTIAPSSSPAIRIRIALFDSSGVKLKMNTRFVVAIASFVLVVWSQPGVAEGDPEIGKQLGFTCLGCHGIEGQRNAYPSFRVPRLGGQKAEYLTAALKAYRAGTRPHPTMHAQAVSITDEDIDNLVAWIGTFGEARDTATAEQVAAVAAAQTCITCHGADAVPVQPVPPTLAGQHADYIEHALNAYKNGTRSGNVMNGFAAALSDADIKMLAKFYSSQEGLRTLK